MTPGKTAPTTSGQTDKTNHKGAKTMTLTTPNHAGPISPLDVAPLMLDELKHQIRELDHRLKRTRPFEPEKSEQEVWLTARTICYKLRQQGYNVSPDLLRKWVERGKLEANKDSAEHNLYRLSKVIQLLS